MGTESGTSLSSASFYCQDYAKTPILGTLSIMGGTIVRNATVTGEFSGTSQSAGYGESYSYDPRMSYKGGPLVAYPSTNQYKLESWQMM